VWDLPFIVNYKLTITITQVVVGIEENAATDGVAQHAAHVGLL